MKRPLSSLAGLPAAPRGAFTGNDLMQYVRLGATGLKVSRLSLGTLGYGDPKWHEWTLGEEAALPFFKAALEKGINFIDTADAYSAGASETVTGKALKEF